MNNHDVNDFFILCLVNFFFNFFDIFMILFWDDDLDRFKDTMNLLKMNEYQNKIKNTGLNYQHYFRMTPPS